MPTQINFPLTTPANMTRYFMSHEDAVYGDLDTSSPSYDAWFGVNRIHLRSDVDAQLFYEAGSGYSWYSVIDTARNFTIDVDFSIAQLDELQWMTTLPNFTTPADTLAKARTYLICRKINNASAMTESFQFLRHAVPTSLEITTAQSTLLAGRCTLVPRLISVPVFTANGGLTTPTFPALGSISLPIWRPQEAGTDSITIDSVPYPITTMTTRWTQGFAFDRVYGSDLLDAATLGTLTVNGTFTSKAFKDMVSRTKVESGTLSNGGVNAKLELKAGSGEINFTKFTVKNLDETIEFGSNTTHDETFEFEAATAIIAAS